MLITVNTHTHLVDAAPAATPWSGENRALAGRCAR
jgi:hypothetical protein